MIDSIREAGPDDIKLIKAGLRKLSEITGSQYNDGRARDLIRYATSSKASKIWVCGGGVLIAGEASNLWSDRRHIQICALWAEEPEQYDQLIKTCLNWFDQRRGSTIIHYEFSEATEADEALLRSGFTQSGSMIVRRKHGRILKH